MAFDMFRGYIPDVGYDPSQTPSIYDVTRRQKLADLLAQNKIQDAGPLGALATALAGTGSAFESSQAAKESQTGMDAANKALAAALGGDATDPTALLTAGGNPFLPEGETGLVGDMLKKKLGLGTVYGNNMPYMGPDGQLHFAAQTSYGNTIDLPAPGGPGSKWLAPVTYQNTGTNFTPTNKFGLQGDAGNPGGAAPIPINNAQASLDKSWGDALGTQWANAPAELQKEGNLVTTQVAEHNLVDGKIQTALDQIKSNPALMTGTLGSWLQALPGSPQFDLAQTLQTIRANIGFDTLQNMRANSATGGALGQISNMEEQLLQAVNGSIDPGQSAQQLAANLADIRARIAAITQAKQEAMLQDIGRFKAGPQAAPTLGSPTPSITNNTGTPSGLPAPAPLNDPLGIL